MVKGMRSEMTGLTLKAAERLSSTLMHNFADES